jgi:hypothetical protein
MIGVKWNYLRGVVCIREASDALAALIGFGYPVTGFEVDCTSPLLLEGTIQLRLHGVAQSIWRRRRSRIELEILPLSFSHQANDLLKYSLFRQIQDVLVLASFQPHWQ